MAQIDDTIATCLTAIEVEGKTQNTVLSYRASLEDFRRVGRRLGFPDALDDCEVAHVYEFLGHLKERGASPAYRHRRAADAGPPLRTVLLFGRAEPIEHDRNCPQLSP